MKSTIKKLPKGEVTLSVSLPAADFASYRDKALKRVQSTVEIDGFRKGNAPEDQIIKKYGDMVVLEEMANLALRDVYVKALEEHKLLPIAEPRVSITKLAKDNPLEMDISVVTFPEITLPDYKKISKEEGVTTVEDVTDKEVDDVLTELQKGRGHNHDHSHEGHDHEHDHAHEETVPAPIDDVFAQSFGAEFKTLDDLKKKVRDNLALEKKQKASEKKRTAVIEKLLSETKAELHDVIIESELNRMMAQMRADIGRFGGTWEDYLKHAGKTEAELRTDWRKDAERRALTQFVLNKISDLEKIVPTDAEIEVELVRLMAVVKDADETRAREYLHQALSNEKVLKFLETGEK